MMTTMPASLTAATGMEYNAEATGEKYREIARAMGVKGGDENSCFATPLAHEEFASELFLYKI